MAKTNRKSSRIAIEDLPQDLEITEAEASRIAGGSESLYSAGPLQLFPSGPAKGVQEMLPGGPLQLFPSGPAKGIVQKPIP